PPPFPRGPGRPRLRSRRGGVIRPGSPAAPNCLQQTQTFQWVPPILAISFQPSVSALIACVLVALRFISGFCRPHLLDATGQGEVPGCGGDLRTTDDRRPTTEGGRRTIGDAGAGR